MIQLHLDSLTEQCNAIPTVTEIDLQVMSQSIQPFITQPSFDLKYRYYYGSTKITFLRDFVSFNTLADLRVEISTRRS